MATRVRTVLLVGVNLLIPIAVLIFAVGFFPYKPFLPGLATYEDVPGYSGPLGAPFDKVVFMVVDALRSDFVYSGSSGFGFTQSLIRRGHALPYTAHATSPTITMPRVKALTTGSIPSFLDVILNFAESDTTSTLAGQDTWLAQLGSKGRSAIGQSIGESQSMLEKEQQEKKLVFYGDNTWLKLFPGFFERADGTSSFFVSDFTEVDNNVTRHVPTELQHSDWNALIMHYLGLDHIGHKAGPRSPNMLPKQQEMDGIVETIYNAMVDPEHPHLHRTLLVLCGDHGMNDGGNHGGSSEGERHPALTFISPLLEMVSRGGNESPTKNSKGDCCGYYEIVEQSDVVPTLSGLLGVPVPKNNLGVFIDGVLGFWDDEAQLQLLLQNARQMLNIVQATFPNEDYNGEHAQNHGKPKSAGAELAFKWRKVDGLVQAKARGAQLRKEHMKPLIVDFLKSAQEILSSTASNYNVGLLGIGISISAFLTILILFCVPLSWPPSIEVCFFTLVTIAYGIMMFASSYVEEEQHFWYWVTGGWIVFLYFKGAQSLNHKAAPKFSSALLDLPQTRAGLALLLHRISTHWTTTGVKYAGAPSISSSLLPAHLYLLWTLVAFTYFYTAFLFTQRFNPGSNYENSSSSLSFSPRFNLQRISQLLGAPDSLGHALLLAIVGLVFKISFTAAEAPELIERMEWLRWTTEALIRKAGGLGLVAQARVVFVCLAIAGVSVAWSELMATKPRKRSSPEIASLAEWLQPLLTLFLLTQSRAQNIPLFLIFEFEQRLIGQLFDSAFSSSAPSFPADDQASTNAGFTSPSEPPHTSDASPSPSTTRTLTITLTALLLTHTSFFAPGGSNAISSIDLSNAYNGIAGYEVGMVGVLLFFGNWAGPVWWGWQAWIWLDKAVDRPKPEKSGDESKQSGRSWVQEERKLLQDLTKPVREADGVTAGNSPSMNTNAEKGADREQSPYFIHVALLTLFTTVSLLAVQVACTALRTHLFIWTVFSPKYLYAMAWSGGWHLLWTCMFGSLIWRISGCR